MIGRDQSVAVGRRLAEPRADSEDQVRVADALLELWVRAVAKISGIDLARVADRVLAAERGRDRDSVAKGKVREMVRGARAPVGAADDRDRVGRVLQQLEHRLDRAGVRLLGERRNARAVRRLDFVAQHVLGQRQHDRAGPTSSRDAVCPRDIFGDAPRVLDPRRQFGDRAEEGGEVDFLEALAVAVAARNVADEQDHRGRILEGDMDAGAGVGRAGTARDEGDAGPPGHLAVGVGHIGDAAFLPADDSVDFRRVMERVEHGEKALARHGEDPVATLDPELVDEDAATGA